MLKLVVGAAIAFVAIRTLVGLHNVHLLVNALTGLVLSFIDLIKASIHGGGS